MAWFKVDDHLHSHRKSMRAGTEAMGLWVLAGSWSGAEESDGWVPSYVLGRLVGANGAELAERLVAAGLWSADVADGEDGYRFHEWETYQPTRAQQEAKRADARDRMRRARSQGGSVRANSEGTSRAVTPTRPDPTRPPNNTTAPVGAEPELFADFWTTYPRKVGKGAAAKAYAKALRTTPALEVLEGLHNAVASWTAARTESRYIPHASTWLNEGRWADEVPLPDMPPASRPTVTVAVCEGDQCPGARHEWTSGRTTYTCLGD